MRTVGFLVNSHPLSNRLRPVLARTGPRWATDDGPDDGMPRGAPTASQAGRHAGVLMVRAAKDWGTLQNPS